MGLNGFLIGKRMINQWIWKYPIFTQTHLLGGVSGVGILIDFLLRFEIIDADGSGTLHVGELVHGLLKIRGDIKRLGELYLMHLRVRCGIPRDILSQLWMNVCILGFGLANCNMC